MVPENTAPPCSSYQWGRSVPPPAKLTRRGALARTIPPTAGRVRVVRISCGKVADVIAPGSCRNRSGVLEPLNVHKLSSSEHPVAFDQLSDPLVKRSFRLETCGTEPLARDDIVALVRVAPQRGDVDGEVLDVFPDLHRELLLGEVCSVEPDVVRPARHALGVPDAVEEAVGDIPDMNEVPFEVFLEEDESPPGDGLVNEMVDEQIEPHPGRRSKNGGQPKRDRVWPLQDGRFGLHLGAAVQRDGLEGSLLGTVVGSRPGPVTAVGCREYDELPWAAAPEQQPNGIEVDRPGQGGVAITRRRTHDRGQGDQDVRL